jgi:hypothetical protein
MLPGLLILIALKKCLIDFLHAYFRPVQTASESRIISSTPRLESVLLTQYCPGDKTENNEMGGVCSTYGVEERRIQGFGGET